MSLSVGLAVVLQVVTVACTVRAFRGRVITRIGPLWTVMVFAYGGAVDLALWVHPGGDQYRDSVAAGDRADWVVLESLTLAVFAAAYAAASRVMPGRQSVDETLPEVERRRLDWRILTAITVPLAAWTLTGVGRSYAGLSGPPTGSAYWTTGLSAEFLTLLSALTAVAVVDRFGRRLLVPVVVLQALVIAAPGERREVIVAGMLTLAAFRAYGVRLDRRNIAAVVLCLGITVAAIAASRVAVGRQAYAYGGTSTSRVDALYSGLADLNGKTVTTGSAAGTGSFASRLDTESWGGAILAGLRNGGQPVGLTTLTDAVRNTVPRFLAPGKMALPLERRSEPLYIDTHFGIDVSDAWIPGQIAPWLAYVGTYGIIPFAVLAGVVVAGIDAALAHRTATRLVLNIGALMAVMSYEAGVPVTLLQFRGAVALTTLPIIVGIARKLRRPVNTHDANTARLTSVDKIAEPDRHRDDVDSGSVHVMAFVVADRTGAAAVL